MPDGNSEPEFFSSTPFRAEMPVSDWERVKSAQQAITHDMMLAESAEYKPLVAQALSEMMTSEYPNEVKMEAFQAAASMIEHPGELETNLEVAKSLIDMLRMQTDKTLLFRLASIISHQVQEKYFDYEMDGFDIGKYNNFSAKKLAFTILAKGDAGNESYREHANIILNPKPGQVLDMFNSMYKLGVDLKINPRIVEEISREDNEFEFSEGETSEGSKFTGNLMKLNPNRIPTIEKIEQYKKITGHDLPYFIVRKTGGKLFMVEFPRSLIEKTDHLGRAFRNGEISRKQAFDQLASLGIEFLDLMNPEQQAQFLDENVNIEIRFSTERSEGIKTENSKVNFETGENIFDSAA